MTPIFAVLRPIRFTKPTKPMWIHHHDKTRSPVVRVIVYGDIPIGIIWTFADGGDYNAWWLLDRKPLRAAGLKVGSVGHASLRGAMNASVRCIRNEINGVITLLKE